MALPPCSPWWNFCCCKLVWSLSDFVFAGERKKKKAPTEDTWCLTDNRTQSVFKLDKILKGGVSMESQWVSAARISVPVSGREVSPYWGFGYLVSQYTDCLCCPLDVSDRQHIPAPCFHPHPAMAGPSSSLPPFPWLHCLWYRTDTLWQHRRIHLLKQAKMQIHDFQFLKKLVSSFPMGKLEHGSLVPQCVTMHWWTIHLDVHESMALLPQSRCALLRGDQVILDRDGNATPGCADGVTAGLSNNG